jgi:predicted GNAT family acetyltransferase
MAQSAAEPHIGVFTVAADLDASGIKRHTGAPALTAAAAPDRSAGEARLEYAVRPSRGGGLTLELVHTFSPPAARGRGLAAALTLAALRYARVAGCAAVLPSCTYASHTFLARYGGAPGGGVVAVEELRLRVQPAEAPEEAAAWVFVDGADVR